MKNSVKTLQIKEKKAYFWVQWRFFERKPGRNGKYLIIRFLCGNNYPFGMAMEGMAYQNPDQETQNKYLYNGKELQDDLGLNWYDYGARFYDAQLGRWHSVDPLAEKYESWSVYQYVRNNPILRIDPNGMDDYTINKKTGEVKLVKKTDDKTDRVLRTYRRKSKRGQAKYRKNGKAKVAFRGVAKGILSEERNFQEKDEIIQVGRDGQPSVNNVKSFVLQLSEYVRKEIKGFSYSAYFNGKATDVLLGKYKYNSYKESHGALSELYKKYDIYCFEPTSILEQFHTHPDGKLAATQSNPEKSDDVINLQRDKRQAPNARFTILYRVDRRMKTYDYTHEYKSKK